MSVSIFYASDRCHRQLPGTRRRCNSPQHKIKGLFYPFITVCYRVEQMSFHSAVQQQEQGTHSQSMVGCQNKSKTFFITAQCTTSYVLTNPYVRAKFSMR